MTWSEALSLLPDRLRELAVKINTHGESDVLMAAADALSDLRPRTGHRDAGGFERRWGVSVFREPRRSPWISVGLHLDWHTPTLDLHLVRWVVQVGRNVWQEGRRFVYAESGTATGHTDQCTCPRDV